MILLIFLSTVSPVPGKAQDSINYKKRLNWVRYGGLGAYTLGMVGLNEVWYSQSPRTSFRFFNDAAEWKQTDKTGHFFNAFQVSSITYQTLTWAGSQEKKRALSSSLIALGLMSSIEIFDGFSYGYGASIFDVAANTTGCLLFWGQMAGWKEIRLYPKYSFHQTALANMNRKLLGSNFAEQFIKDYNGQTVWLSADMDKFMPFPKWLNIAIGYGAQNMIKARDSENAVLGYYPYRQYYLSIDFDVTVIKTKSKFLKSVLYLVNMIKVPAPTLEFSQGKVKGHWLYF